MTLHQYVDGVEVTVENEPTPGPWQTASHGGEMGGGGDEGAGAVVVVDPTGVLDIRGWRNYRADETDSVGRESIFRGFIKGKQIKRGAEGPIGAGRVWECEIGDGNLLLQLRKLEGSDAKRPAETNLTRIAWLLAKLQGYGVPLYDTGHVLDSHPRPFEDADYTDQTAQDVLDDISGIIGRDYFVFWDFDASGGAKWSLWYNRRAANDMASPLSISNVAGEANYTTIFPTGAAAEAEDASLSRQPDEVYSREILKYRNGKVTRTLASTATTFIERDHFTDNSRIGVRSTAIAAADAFLDAHSVEKDTITVPVRLPSTKVNLAIAGETIDLHLEHEPGYESGFVTTRISKRTVSKPTIDQQYDCLLECTLAAPASTSSGGSDDFPHTSSCAPGTGDLVQANTATGFVNNITVALSSTPTAGSTQVMAVTLRAAITANDPTGWTTIPEASVSPFENTGITYYKTTPASDAGSSTWAPTGTGSSDAAAVIAEFAGELAYDTSAELVSTDPFLTGPNFVGATVTPTAGKLAVIVGMAEYKYDNAHGDPTAGAGWTMLGTIGAGGVTRIAVVYKVVASTSGSYTPAFVSAITPVVYDSHSYGAQTVVLICDASATPPAAGQWVYGELVTLTGGAGTTQFAFADGSLRVRYDIVDQTPAIVSYDGAARTFQMPSDPPLGTQVFVDYQGR